MQFSFAALYFAELSWLNWLQLTGIRIPFLNVKEIYRSTFTSPELEFQVDIAILCRPCNCNYYKFLCLGMSHALSDTHSSWAVNCIPHSMYACINFYDIAQDITYYACTSGPICDSEDAHVSSETNLAIETMIAHMHTYRERHALFRVPHPIQLIL